MGFKDPSNSNHAAILWNSSHSQLMAETLQWQYYPFISDVELFWMREPHRTVGREFLWQPLLCATVSICLSQETYHEVVTPSWPKKMLLSRPKAPRVDVWWRAWATPKAGSRACKWDGEISTEGQADCPAWGVAVGWQEPGSTLLRVQDGQAACQGEERAGCFDGTGSWTRGCLASQHSALLCPGMVKARQWAWTAMLEAGTRTGAQSWAEMDPLVHRQKVKTQYVQY